MLLALVVRNGIEDLINIMRVLDFNFNGVRTLQAIEVQCTESVTGHETSPYVPLREEMINGLVANPRSEAFIQPKTQELRLSCVVYQQGLII